MNHFVEIHPGQLNQNVFTRIGTDWMLITAAQGDRVNMMTASWGGMGIYWGKPAAICFIRPQRFTKSFVDGAQGYSLTFFPKEYREQLNFCGGKSGRDFDKVKECGFTTLYEGGIPYFAEADTALICRHLVAVELTEDSFRNKEVIASAYPGEDFHTLYLSEITNVLVRE